MVKESVCIFWFRRDLRLDDNVALHNALKSGNKVLPIFIFDNAILEELPKNDHRVSLVYDQLKSIDLKLKECGSSLFVKRGKTLEIWSEIIETYNVTSVYCNKDFEPYSIERDLKVNELLFAKSISFNTYLDHLIFNPDEIVKADGKPYTVFTPYKNKWLKYFQKELHLNNYIISFKSFLSVNIDYPSREFLGFVESNIKINDYNLAQLDSYDLTRDFPAKNSTSYLSPYLRFGMVSIRKVVSIALDANAFFLNELIWREFFAQVLFHYPKVVTSNFRSKYDNVVWVNNEIDFEKWCNGHTGYPLVDAGMKQLNKTGYMHNRVRMITAGFLCKHLLIDWRWGEAYFAKKLFDYELASNNGNWQWAAGTGCDAAPYFRVFNPTTQQIKFDKKLEYINKWLPSFNSIEYTLPIIDHKAARNRALSVYKKAIN